MKAHLARNSLTGVAQFIVSIATVLISIPVFIRYLGSERYGIFSLVAVVGSVNAFANLGLNSSLVRFLAQQGKTVESDHDIVVSLGLLCAVLCPLTVFGFAFQDRILSGILNVPPGMLEESGWLFRSMLIGNVFVLLGQTFTAILDAQQKNYLTNSFQMIYNILYWGLVLLVVVLGHALEGVAMAILVATTAWFFIVATAAFRSWGGITFAGLRNEAIRSARKQLSYGVQVYTAGLIGFLYEPFTKILVSRFLGVTEVGLFDIGLRVRNQVYGLAARMIYPLFPVISQVNDPVVIRKLVHDVEQKIIFVIMPVIAVVVLASKPGAHLLFAANIDAIAVTVACMTSAALLGSIAVMPNYLFLMSKGHVGKTLLLQAINVVVNAAVYLAFVGWMGYYAIVLANASAILASGVVSLYYQKRYLQSLIFDTMNQVFGVLLAFSVALALGAFLVSLTPGDHLQIAVAVVAVGGVTLLLYRHFMLFTPADVVRYLGEGSPAARVAVQILCGAPGRW